MNTQKAVTARIFVKENFLQSPLLCTAAMEEEKRELKQYPVILYQHTDLVNARVQSSCIVYCVLIQWIDFLCCILMLRALSLMSWVDFFTDQWPIHSGTTWEALTIKQVTGIYCIINMILVLYFKFFFISVTFFLLSSIIYYASVTLVVIIPVSMIRTL